ncbi:MAG: T9SS type A sorting domain-containing protein [Bacteroidetes bacterium]|nr:T9SS type A sorting domain-containing protein [Bacteroidota bacterium]
MAANASNESEEMEIEVYPNPVINYATLAFNIDSPGEANIVIMDITGRVVKQFSLMNLAMGINQVGFDTSELTNGVYYVRIIQNDKIAGKKLVIEK